jgi:hypothetical protein
MAMSLGPSLGLSIWGWAEMGFLPAGKGADRYGPSADFPRIGDALRLTAALART